MMNKPQLTPLEQLTADRERIKKACAEQEQILNDDFVLIRENAPGIIFSGVTSLISSRFKHNPKEKGTSNNQSENNVNYSSLFSNYFVLAKQAWPVIWEITRPLLTAWSIQTIQKWIVRKFLTKKK